MALSEFFDDLAHLDRVDWSLMREDVELAIPRVQLRRSWYF